MSLRPGNQGNAPTPATWFAVLAPPLAWLAQLNLGWWIEAWSCGNDKGGYAWTGGGGAQWLQFGISVIALAVALLALVIGISKWRASASSGITADTSARPDFMAAIAVFMSAVFAVAIVWAGLATLLLPVCVTAR